MAPPRHQLQNLIGDFPAFRDMVMGSALACLMMNFEISKTCIPARRNIFNSCLFLLLMRFPASWKLLIGLPAFGFCFDYVRSTSTYLLSDLFYRPKLRAILSKLASGRAPWRNWTLCSGCSSTSSWIAQSLTRQEQWLSNYHAQVALAETQIFLATEVGAAFSRLEEGYEGALKQYTRSR